MRRILRWVGIAFVLIVLLAAGYELGGTTQRSHENSEQIKALCKVVNENLKIMRQITLLQRRLLRGIALERKFSPELLNFSERTFREILIIARPRKC